MENFEFNNKKVRICGKIAETDMGLELKSSGSFIEFSGNINRVSMELAGSFTEHIFQAYAGVFLNGNSILEKIIKVEQGRHHYEIYLAEKKKNTTVKIVKLTELQYGTIQICSLDIDGKIRPTEPQKRKLMFIGDSITAGYGVSGDNSDLIFTTATENVTKAYPYLASQKLKADSWYICWSGGGIISRWIPPEEELPLTDVLMPELFEKGKDLEFIPDLISVNLGTNDASYTRGKADREESFIKKYEELVLRIADVYPDAHILLQYGLMENTLTHAVQKVFEFCDSQGIKCSFLELPLSDAADGMGTGGHPSFVTHQKTASLLEAKIREILDWKE